MTARVLHVLDQPGDTPESLALRLSADDSRHNAAEDETHAWLLLGGEAMRDAAHAAGIDDARLRLLPRPTRLQKVIPGAQRAILRLLEQAGRVECWTPGGATVATRLGCAHIVPRFGQATLCEYAKQVIDHACSNPSPLRERPGEGVESDLTDARALIRSRWGISDDTFIVALLADHPDQVDAREAWLAVAFVFETLAAAKAERGDVRLLCHPMSFRRAQADDLSDLLDQPQLVMQDARVLTPWQVLSGCDIALAPSPRAAGLSILWANAMGLPIIAPPEPMLPLLSELRHVTPAKSDAAKHLAYTLQSWVAAQQSAGQSQTSFAGL